MIRIALAASLAMVASYGASAQTADQLVKGATDTSNVLNYGMGYNLQRFSPLTQISRDNAKNLVPVWSYSFADDRSEESQPLVYQGVIYATTHNATMAIDAKTGKQVWKSKIEYPAETPRIVCCGIINRGAAIFDGKLFRTTLDANVIALDAKTGKELWRQKAADIKEGYSMTVAPLVADGVVITGISGAEYGTRGFIDGWDPATGKHLWRTHSIPSPDEPGGDTWKGDTWKLGGGSTWITGSYDAELNTVYWGIGNPGPFNSAVRPGDNLYTCSVLALDPKSGKIKWHYQFSPNNPFDYDSVAEMVLADINVEGKPTKVLMDANRNGFLPDQRQTARGQSLCEGQLGDRHRHEDRPADRDRCLQGCPRRQEGRGVSFYPRRQELGADVVQSADGHGLCQYARVRRPLQDRTGDLQGRRMVSRHGSDRPVGLAG
jgi:alcohol dehydrogenase (cytochrome c)